jgi:hypothetical protein
LTDIRNLEMELCFSGMEKTSRKKGPFEKINLRLLNDKRPTGGSFRLFCRTFLPGKPLKNPFYLQKQPSGLPFSCFSFHSPGRDCKIRAVSGGGCMADFEFEPNDEVFNILTRKVGTVLNVKEVGSPLIPGGKKYVRVFIKNDLPDEIWAYDEIALWVRPKRMMERQ